MAKSKLETYAEDLVERVLEGDVSINEAIEDLEKRLEVYERVKVNLNKLLSARRAMMGVGPRMTNSGGGARISQDEVVRAMSDEGMSIAELVEAVPGANDGQIRGHLNRGKGERFLKRADNKWFLRDPEKGIDTVNDLPQEDED